MQELLSDYEKVFEMFRSECARLTDTGLSEIVACEEGKKATVRWGILSFGIEFDNYK